MKTAKQLKVAFNWFRIFSLLQLGSLFHSTYCRFLSLLLHDILSHFDTAPIGMDYILEGLLKIQKIPWEVVSWTRSQKRTFSKKNCLSLF